MVIKLARAGKEEVIMPSMDSIEACIELVSQDSTTQSAQYLSSQFEKRLKETGLEDIGKFANVVKALKDLVTYVTSAFSGGAPWSGIKLEQPVANFHADLASHSAANLDVKQPIQCDFAVSDQSELRRGYSTASTNDGTIGEETTEKMDTLLNAWLVNNQMINRDGVVYNATNNATNTLSVKQDNNGNPERANPERLKAQMMDGVNGLKAFILQKNSALQITVNLRSYGGEEPAEKSSSETASTKGQSS